YIGRSYEMAPDIDGCIYVKGNGAKKDQFCKVKIEKALEYDLVGVVCNESCK
ncbi:MAG: 30S ribosomal protein S12 methylthiotransferase RimO, partial [Clostridium perfringens]|nr:30S ribosomal protein S12 methylthiotransferase RimO [Clostridium perfringens]MDU7964678.1 30S ribosomal protein S12 methylthiotransferase RimO [Clostridium perfringens]